MKIHEKNLKIALNLILALNEQIVGVVGILFLYIELKLNNLVHYVKKLLYI